MIILESHKVLAPSWFNILNETIALFSHFVVNKNIKSVFENICHYSAILLGSDWVIIDIFSIFTYLVESSNVIWMKLSSSLRWNSKNLKNLSKIFQITPPIFVIDELNESHTQIWRTNCCKWLNWSLIHANCRSCIDTSKTVSYKMAFFSSNLRHQFI